ncbi:hypothetical protein [Actinoalloteichus hymeniacidonis]|uniref:hypothetical protein n=1 Tax=Actinoalloteichus hymeniacidonis TaxID=340345 RepID=UPI0008539574|nr:hypothetical protein [Actinoalloteichus hymeniacidonis]MBB5908575.1 formate dehydrogenase maturation protein FdhE [Actinoalloteichus hymeniacidonis]
MSVDRRSPTHRCPSCGRSDLTEVSRHRTSDGTLRYLRCGCARWLVVRESTVLATAVSGWWQSATGITEPAR